MEALQADEQGRRAEVGCARSTQHACELVEMVVVVVVLGPHMHSLFHCHPWCCLCALICVWERLCCVVVAKVCGDSWVAWVPSLSHHQQGHAYLCTHQQPVTPAVGMLIWTYQHPSYSPSASHTSCWHAHIQEAQRLVATSIASTHTLVAHTHAAHIRHGEREQMYTLLPMQPAHTHIVHAHGGTPPCSHGESGSRRAHALPNTTRAHSCCPNPTLTGGTPPSSHGESPEGADVCAAERHQDPQPMAQDHAHGKGVCVCVCVCVVVVGGRS